MRVIAGKYKRRLLSTLPGHDVTRPTSDRVKESLFNIIADIIQNSVVLDLFAGSGALGIEALSRGAQKAIFIEKNPKAYQIVKSNLHNLQVPTDNYLVIKNDAATFLQNKDFETKIDIVFIDPPYLSEWYENALQELDDSQICSPFCTVIFEMPAQHKFQLQSKSQEWSKIDERIYGKTKIEIWQKGNSE